MSTPKIQHYFITLSMVTFNQMSFFFILFNFKSAKLFCPHFSSQFNVQLYSLSAATPHNSARELKVIGHPSNPTTKPTASSHPGTRERMSVRGCQRATSLWGTKALEVSA